MLRPLIGAALLAASTALLAQAPADASKAPQRKQRFDCSQAQDPKACEERRQKLREAHREAAKKAREACQAKPEAERRDCVRAEMRKQRADKRKQRTEQDQKQPAR
jgi:hypothetical protein